MIYYLVEIRWEKRRTEPWLNEERTQTYSPDLEDARSRALGIRNAGHAARILCVDTTAMTVNPVK